MPNTEVKIYCEADGTVPLLNWLDSLPKKAIVKCRMRIERLQIMGHELRRPEADYLRDGIYELRASLQGVHYRILYFFHDQKAIVISHGLNKEDQVPANEIDRAIERKEKYVKNPIQHTYAES